MTYAIIRVGGKQYRVREGERLLVDRLPHDDGTTFAPDVLLLGGDAAPVLEPGDSSVTARVLGPAKGPKVRIGKYKKRTGYRRHTGFRASLTQIEIESIGGKPARGAKPKAAPASAPKATIAPEARKAPSASALPEGYEKLTVAAIKEVCGGWSAEELSSALAFEEEHGQRKGAIAALESALAEQQGGES